MIMYLYTNLTKCVLHENFRLPFKVQQRCTVSKKELGAAWETYTE